MVGAKQSPIVQLTLNVNDEEGCTVLAFGCTRGRVYRTFTQVRKSITCLGVWCFHLWDSMVGGVEFYFFGYL